jgi:chromosomal replication initiator protein
VPALFGAIRQLELATRTEHCDVAQLERMTAEQIHQARPTLREIATAAARHFGLKLADLKSASRRQAVVVARGVAFYLARQLTDHSLQEIGKYFGGRDHTTVLHGHRRTEKMLKRDPATRHAISELRKSLAA